MGKTVLLADAAGRARSAGVRVLPVTGRESESRLAFAGLHQLLRPVLSGAARASPGRPGACWGRSAWHRPPVTRPAPIGVAVLTLLSDLSDAPRSWWPRTTPTGWTAARWTRWPSPAAAWTPTGSCCWSAPAGRPRRPVFDCGFPELHLEPLSADNAGRLLDGQPRPPRGRARAQVLAQAAGNPMALIELATVIADDPAASRRWAAEPLPPSDRLSAVLTSRFAALPGRRRPRCCSPR